MPTHCYNYSNRERERVEEQEREELERNNSEANLGDEVRAYITRLLSEKNKESEQLYKAEQCHQVMLDQAAAMKSQMRIKDDQISALTAQVATLTKSININHQHHLSTSNAGRRRTRPWKRRRKKRGEGIYHNKQLRRLMLDPWLGPGWRESLQQHLQQDQKWS